MVLLEYRMGRFRKEISGDGWDGKVFKEVLDNIEDFNEVVEVNFTKTEKDRLAEVRRKRLEILSKD